MKKSELKEIVKECIKDVLFEEGMLSSLIAEIAIGINQAQSTLVENNTQQQEQAKSRIAAEKQKTIDMLRQERQGNARDEDWTPEVKRKDDPIKKK